MIYIIEEKHDRKIVDSRRKGRSQEEGYYYS